ncbi:MAG: XRE family transcriptional regulator [Bryobacterales bacterium]|nr:XRE family transcriptional regulator [Bryobacterales bacterium]MEB2363892.1 XRE family transcriptional regulator [Bryobacterales bacterium]
MIGARIRLVREVCGMTQKDLGDLIGTTQSGVASIEAGLYRPSPEFLDTIAQRTGFKASFFEKREATEFPVGTLLYRAQASVKKSARNRAHAMANLGFEVALLLSSKLKKIAINIPRLNEDPVTCAQITRASLGLSPNTPIKNLMLCLEKNGVFVLSVPMEADGFDGFSSWAGMEPPKPIIALLEGKYGYRQVFTMAEELGHLVMHSPLRVSLQDADQEARGFAREFLLPAEAMRAEMQSPVTISGLAPLKPRWGVSIRFLAKRADSLGLVTKNQFRYLMQQINGWGKLEPGDGDITPERPRLLRKMAEMAYGSPIDFGKLSADAGLSPGMLRSLLSIEERARVLEFKSRQ